MQFYITIYTLKQNTLTIKIMTLYHNVHAQKFEQYMLYTGYHNMLRVKNTAETNYRNEKKDE